MPAGDLDPTPSLLDTARRIANREVVVGHDEPSYPPADPDVHTLVDAGRAVLYYPPTRLQPDGWRLTDAGRVWLDRHSKEAQR